MERSSLPEVGDATRFALAAVLVGAGVIHLVMAPTHLREDVAEGIGFLVTGWLQIALASAVMFWFRRAVLLAVIGINGAAIGIWIISRTFGLPVGEHTWHPAEISAVDSIAVLFELAAIGISLAVIARVRESWLRAGGVVALTVPVAVVILTTAAIAAPSTRDHASASHGDHQPSGHHSASADDLGLSLIVEQHGDFDVAYKELTPRERFVLDEQLAITANLIELYPTLADAEAAGYEREGPFDPGRGTHYVSPESMLNTDGQLDPEDLARPVLLYDGFTPDSPLAGFMYVIMSPDEPTEGFAGPNDHWHAHEADRACILLKPDGKIEAPFGALDRDFSKKECEQLGGREWPLTGWLVHVWTVPGYESSRGVFSAINPALTCPDGTYFRVEIPGNELRDRPTFCRTQ